MNNAKIDAAVSRAARLMSLAGSRRLLSGRCDGIFNGISNIFRINTIVITETYVMYVIPPLGISDGSIGNRSAAPALAWAPCKRGGDGVGRSQVGVAGGAAERTPRGRQKKAPLTPART